MKDIDNKMKLSHTIIGNMWVGLLYSIIAFILAAMSGKYYFIIPVVFFGLAYYFAKKENILAGVFEFITGVFLIIFDFVADSAIGLNGIIGVILLFQASAYIICSIKNK